MFGCRSPICRGNVRTVYACPICIFIKLNCDRGVGVTRLRSSFSTSSYILRSLRAERCTLLLFSCLKLSVWKQVLPGKVPLVSACMFPLKFTPSLRPLLRVSSHRYHLWYLQKHKVPPRHAERFAEIQQGAASCSDHGKPPHTVSEEALSRNSSLWLNECLRMGFCNNTLFFSFVFCFLKRKMQKKKVNETCFEQVSVCLLSLDQRSAPSWWAAVFFVCYLSSG